MTDYFTVSSLCVSTAHSVYGSKVINLTTFILAVLRELIAAGELKGTLHGRLENATFIPDVYSVMQKKWVNSFFTSNDYLGRIRSK